MKNSILLTAFALIIISCGGVKSPKGQSDVYIPCQEKEFKSDKKFFRAFGSSVSNNPSGAIEEAEVIASEQLTLNIKRKVKVVSERYSENITDGLKGEYKASSRRMGVQISSQTIGKTSIVCSKTTQDNATGMYRHYIAIEMPVDAVINEYVNGISNDSKNEIKVNREQFREIFESEMSKR